MKTFSEFIKGQAVIEEEGLQNFLKQHGLEDDWQSYRTQPKPIDQPRPEPKGWNLNPDEAVRDINYIIKSTIDSTSKVNKFGIDDIKLEVINKEETVAGIKLDIEAHGTATVRNEDHIKKLLADIMNRAKKPLAEKGIHISVLYNKIDTSAAVEEETNLDNPAIGLVRKLEFRVICVAILNKKIHRMTN